MSILKVIFFCNDSYNGLYYFIWILAILHVELKRSRVSCFELVYFVLTFHAVVYYYDNNISAVITHKIE